MSITDIATPLGETELLRFVSRRGLTAELVRPGAPTPTVAAAAALGVERDALLRLSVATLHAVTRARRAPLTEAVAQPASPSPPTLGDPS